MRAKRPNILQSSKAWYGNFDDRSFISKSNHLVILSDEVYIRRVEEFE